MAKCAVLILATCRANASKSLFVRFLSKTLGVFSKHFVHPRDHISAKSYNIKVYFLLYGTITNFVPYPLWQVVLDGSLNCSSRPKFSYFPICLIDNLETIKNRITELYWQDRTSVSRR